MKIIVKTKCLLSKTSKHTASSVSLEVQTHPINRGERPQFHTQLPAAHASDSKDAVILTNDSWSLSPVRPLFPSFFSPILEGFGSFPGMP